MSSLLTLCRLCFVRMPQLILHHVHSCLSVTYLFLVFPHSVSDLWREQSLVRLIIVPKSSIPNFINEVRGKISLGLALMDFFSWLRVVTKSCTLIGLAMMDLAFPLATCKTSTYTTVQCSMYIQCVFLKVKILMLFVDRVNVTFGQNNWCHFFPETGPF